MYIDGMIVFDVEESSVQELLGNLGMQIRIEDKSVSELFLGRKKRITVLKKDTSKMQSKKIICKFSNRFMNLWLHLKMQPMIIALIIVPLFSS